MKRTQLTKIIAMAIVVGSMSTIFPKTAYAEWEHLQNGNWKYTKNNTVITGWKQINGSWYNFDSEGIMKTGWINDGSKWYFTDNFGQMKTGWVNNNGKWYFTDKSGEMKTGWINDGGKWYFTDNSGEMKTGWVKDNDTWYFTNSSGAMETGVVQVEGKVYYLAESGAMQVGKVIIDNIEYTFAATGESIGDLPKVNKSFNKNGQEKINSNDSLNQNTSTVDKISNSNSNNSSNNNSSTHNEEQSKWNLVWSDEFNGTSLDTDKWEYQYGNGSIYGLNDWGNKEKQYYTKDNVKVEDGNLIIEAKKEEDTEEFGGKEYSSARIRTLGKYSKTYGKIEAAITLPKGQGLWPAFWMLPDDNDVYGPWASGGEIDIMEARGRVPNVVDGTIHFGQPWPNNKSNGGHYTFPEGQDITGKHVYAVEWEPGEIRWYVDGKLYYTSNNWFSQGANEPAPYPYPAPFNKDFHILLNLAVGGNYDGGINPNDEDLPAEMKIDYVRVYDLKGDYPVHEKPYLESGDLEGARQPLENGSYILDPKFNNIEDNSGKDLSYYNWNFLTTSGGIATFDNSKDGLNVDITNGGNQSYSVQLIDHMPLRTNKTYTVKFKAKADSNRSITAQFGGGPERSWNKYSELNVVNLTTDLTEYEYSFDMKEESDVHGRLEFNLGTNTTDVYITDVEVTEKDTVVDPNAAKEPLEDGNHIYNGKFNLGDNYKEFWDFAGNASFNVNENGEAEINVPSVGEKESVVLSQSGINLLEKDTYKLSFTAKADKAGQMDAVFESLDGDTVYGEKSFDLTTTDKTYEYEFTMLQDVTDEKAVIKFLLGSINGKAYIDNVKVERLTNNMDWNNIDSYPLKNGNFNGEFAKWNKLTNQSGSNASFAVEDGVASIDITNLGTEGWNNMLFSNSMSLVKGIDYVVEFDAWSDEARDIVAKIENSSYTPCFEEIVSLGTDKKRFKYEFSMASDDDTEQFKFLLGAMDNAKNTKVYIDNVVLKVKNTPFKMAPTLIADEDDNKLGNDIEINYVGGDAGWSSSISSIVLGKDEIDKDLYNISNDTITLDSSCFDVADNYDIIMKSEGYCDTEVTQTVRSNNNNLVINGDFSNGLNGWGSYYSWGNDNVLPLDVVTTTTTGAAVITTGPAVTITIIGGVAQQEITNSEQVWSHQFYQNDISLQGGKTYELSFDAKSSVDRAIIVQLGGDGLPGDVKKDLTTEYQTYTIDLNPKSNLNLKLNYLLGNVDLQVPEGEHYVYLKDVKIKEVI